MKEHQEDLAFAENARVILELGLEALDPKTRARLQAARRVAVEGRTKPSPWLISATGLAAVCALLLAVFFLLKMPSIKSPPGDVPLPAVEDLELLSAPESLDFYEDLSFYNWLDTRDLES